MRAICAHVKLHYYEGEYMPDLADEWADASIETHMVGPTLAVYVKVDGRFVYEMMEPVVEKMATAQFTLRGRDRLGPQKMLIRFDAIQENVRRG